MSAPSRTLSASQITAYLMCARKYFFRYIERRPPEHVSAALAFGSAVHSALEWFHDRRLTGETVSPDLAIGIFRADWTAESEKPLRFDEDVPAAALVSMGEALVSAYVTRYADIVPVSHETPFLIDLVDPETGEVFPVRLRGYFDLVLPDHQLVEIKTTARRYDAGTLKRHIQLSAYALAYRTLHGVIPSIAVVQLLKTKKPGIDTAVAKRTDEDIAFFVHLAREVASAIDAGAFPPSPGWGCSDCEYGAACAAYRPADTVPANDTQRLGFDDECDSFDLTG